MSLAKPTPRERAKPTRPRTKCAICDHSLAKHADGFCSVRVALGPMNGPSGLCGCLDFKFKMPPPAAVKALRRSPIQRASAPIKRKTKVRKKRKGKRANLARECDRLWSLIVRHRGTSELSGKAGVIQGAHGFSRRYRATRWLLINGFALTAGEHWQMTNDPLAWDDWIRNAWGQPVYDELRAIALKNEKQDMPAILARLRSEADRRGIR